MPTEDAATGDWRCAQMEEDFMDLVHELTGLGVHPKCACQGSGPSLRPLPPLPPLQEVVQPVADTVAVADNLDQR